MNWINHPSIGIAVIPEHLPNLDSNDSSKLSFLNFVFAARENRRYLWIVLIGSTAQFIFFKLCYPYPDFMSDSYDYLESAAHNLNVNLWPVGYAKFLILVHHIGYSDTLLVITQYFLVQLSLLFFFYTVKYLFKPSRLTVKILLIFIFLNPVSLYISNYVLSDALFGSITIVWFSLLLWQLKSTNWLILLLQVMLMGLAFTIRYTAIYYPIMAAITILMSPINWWKQIAWTIAPALLFVPFIRFTQLQTKQITGTAEFSVFGGWQVANNALYMYGHIQVDSTQLPPETRYLDRMVKQFHAWAPPGYINLDDFEGTYFIKHPDAPLKQYMFRYYKSQFDTSYFLAWGKASPIYNKYGTWLISHYPLAFARYYLLLNTKNYFTPYLAQMSLYNMGEDSLWPYARFWFHYPSLRVRSVSKQLQGLVFFAYPSTFLLLNLFYAFTLVWLWVTRNFRKLPLGLQKALWLVTGLTLINAGFSIFATPVVLRYEVVPMLFLFTFSMLLLELTDFSLLKFANK